jgi:hypothetical protein
MVLSVSRRPSGHGAERRDAWESAAMFGMLLFGSAFAIAIATGLVARAAMRGGIGHHVEDMGRLIGG